MASGLAPQPWSDDDFRGLAGLIRARHGAHLPEHRIALLKARLRVRLAARGVPDFASFHQRLLREHPGGPDNQLLIDLGTVNHTAFFREPGPLGMLADHLADRLRTAPSGTVRAWSAGCSAGQEPYSLLMLLAERVPLPDPSRFELIASDLSRDILEAAARAIYDDAALAGMADARRRRFLLRGRGGRSGTFRVSPEVRAPITFRHFDLRRPEWPIPPGLDGILCRNVLIYFSEAERVAMVDRLAAQLRPGGLLVIGNCEILAERPRHLERVAPAVLRKVTP